VKDVKEYVDVGKKENVDGDVGVCEGKECRGSKKVV
jgi:hypothetical protein